MMNHLKLYGSSHPAFKFCKVWMSLLLLFGSLACNAQFYITVKIINSGSVKSGFGFSNGNPAATIDCPNDCSGFASGFGNLEATPGQGYTFHRWTGLAHGNTQNPLLSYNFYYGGIIEAEFKKDGLPLPSITTDLSELVQTCSNATPTLRIEATNATAYQWQMETVLGTNPLTINFQNISDGEIFSGTATNALLIKKPASLNNAKIRCIARGEGGGVDSKTAVIYVLEQPSLSLNPIPLCLGKTLNLSTSSSNADSFSWGASGGNFQSSTAAASVTWSSSTVGQYSVSVTGAAPSPYTISCTNTTTLSLHPLPTVGVVPSTHACVGKPLTLTASGGSSYAWSSASGEFSSTLGSPVSWTQTNTGLYSISLTVNNNTCTNSAITNLTVRDLPQVNMVVPTEPFCAKTQVNLLATSNLSYTWLAPNGQFVNSTSNPAVWSPSVGGLHTLTVEVSDSFCTNMATNTVTVIALPVVNMPAAQLTCEGETISLTASGGSTPLSWNASGGQFVSNSGSPVMWRSATPGAYTVTVMANDFTCTNTNTTSISVAPIPTVQASTSTPTLCVGTVIMLSATGAQNYDWEGPTGYTSNIQRPSLVANSTAFSGLYTVSVNNPGCSATLTQTVSVLAVVTPTASVSFPVLTVCVGKPIPLSAGGGNEFVWTGPSVTGFSSTVQSPNPVALSTQFDGVYTVVVSNRNCDESASTTLSVRVNSIPIVSMYNPPPVCVGANVQLSVTGGYSSYGWTGPRGYTSTSNAPLLSNPAPSASGLYVVVVGNNFSCTTTASTSVGVYPYPTPNASSNSPVCQGNTLQLSASNGNAYSWNGPSGYASSSQNPTLPIAASTMNGTYSVTVRNAGGCSTSGTVSVAVSPNVAPSITSLRVNGNLPNTQNNTVAICNNAAVSLNIAATNAVTYSWRGPTGAGNGFTSSLVSPVNMPIAMPRQGQYTVTVRNGCTVFNQRVINLQLINCTNTRIASAEDAEGVEMEINAYPNPVSKTLMVEVRLREPSALQLNLLNSVGQSSGGWWLKEESTFHKTELNLADLQGGVYLLQVQAGKQKAVKRVVKIQYE